VGLEGCWGVKWRRRTSLGIAFVLLFAPILSATWVDWSAMPGVEVVEEPKRWSWRGCVDLGIFESINQSIDNRK
jgi:hypothetical protein